MEHNNRPLTTEEAAGSWNAREIRLQEINESLRKLAQNGNGKVWKLILSGGVVALIIWAYAGIQSSAVQSKEVSDLTTKVAELEKEERGLEKSIDDLLKENIKITNRISNLEDERPNPKRVRQRDKGY
jgi:cell division protein FtsL